MRNKYKDENNLIKQLSDRNDFFYQKKLITFEEYTDNNMLLIRRLTNSLISEENLDFLQQNITDEISIVRFRLGIKLLRFN